ncbi:MAG: amylo-alpha-1,6-glucosidase [Rudaea sp.]
MSELRVRHRELLDRLVRDVRFEASDPNDVIGREWIVTNGLGGYASGTICGLNTRRYHGWLVAALPNPLGRVVMLERVAETLFVGDEAAARLDVEETVRGLAAGPIAHLAAFRLEAGLPVWHYAVRGRTLEKRVLLARGQNTVYVRYALLSGEGPVRLGLRPAVHFRSYEAPVNLPLQPRYLLVDEIDHVTLSVDGDAFGLRLRVEGPESTFELHRERIDDVVYRVERARGYDAVGSLACPGHFDTLLERGHPVTLIASAEPWETASAIAPDEAPLIERERRRRLLTLAPFVANDAAAAELLLRSDDFVIAPVGRQREATRARALGDQVRTVIAGYHWFTDWGRDTMISLEGLALVTGRHHEAASILGTFARYVRDGLIPNMFPDGSNEGRYNTADATLWFFHALDRYLAATGDEDVLALLLPTLRTIVEHHVRGTHFGIGVDPGDGLLRQGAEHYALTWMDAKVDDWVVTPRRGKAVEINALWYNALRLFAQWLEALHCPEEARAIAERADAVARAFNRRFWYAQGGYLYDVVDGPEGDSCEFRPNQLFAFTLRHPVLERSRWKSVLDKVQERLVTPVGLRSLAPGSNGYCARYDGDLRTRDAAYHQGTVWGWLIGPWIDAWLRVHPGDRSGAQRFLDGLLATLSDFGIGTLAEIFDAEAPFTPRGCIAQAWSVAEALRCLAKLREEASSA